MRKKPVLFEDYKQGYREETIGENIRALRKAKGYNQNELSGIRQVNRSTIKKTETGKIAIKIDYLVKFAWHPDFDIILPETPIARN